MVRPDILPCRMRKAGLLRSDVLCDEANPQLEKRRQCRLTASDHGRQLEPTAMGDYLGSVFFLKRLGLFFLKAGFILNNLDLFSS